MKNQIKSNQKIIALCLLAGLSGFVTTANAQFPSLGSLGGLLGGSSSNANAGSDQQDALVQSYVAADKSVLQAEAKMAEALGLKEDAAKMRATADALSAGSTKDALAEADTIASESSKKIQSRLKENPQLDDAAKSLYASGLSDLAGAGLEYVRLGAGISNFLNILKSNPTLVFGKLATGAYIAKTLPGNISNLKSVVGNAIDFAKSNKIPVPDNATKLL